MAHGRRAPQHTTTRETQHELPAPPHPPPLIHWCPGLQLRTHGRVVPSCVPYAIHTDHYVSMHTAEDALYGTLHASHPPRHNHRCWDLCCCDLDYLVGDRSHVRVLPACVCGRPTRVMLVAAHIPITLQTRVRVVSCHVGGWSTRSYAVCRTVRRRGAAAQRLPCSTDRIVRRTRRRWGWVGRRWRCRSIHPIEVDDEGDHESERHDDDVHEYLVLEGAP